MDLELFANALYPHQKLSRGTRASVGFSGSLRLETRLAVPDGGGLSVVGGHLGVGGETYLHRIRFYAGRADDGDERVWERGDWQETGFNRSRRKRNGDSV